MHLLVVTAIVAFFGGTQATEESNLIPNENFPEALYSEDRWSRPTITIIPYITENPIRFYKTIPIDNNQCLRGPAKKSITTSQQTVMAKSLLKSIEKFNKKTFNQKIDLSATFGSSSTEVGWESATTTKSEESKNLEKTIKKQIKTDFEVLSGQYYCILAEFKLFVYKIDGVPQYIEKPTGLLITGPADYEFLQGFLKEKEAFRSLWFAGGNQLTTYSVKQMVKGAVTANLVKPGIKKMMPEEGKYYTVTSAMFQGVGLETWYGTNDKMTDTIKRVGCMDQTGKFTGPSDWMQDRGYKTNKYRQWEFQQVQPVDKNNPDKVDPGLFYIVNREFNTALYATQSKGLLAKKKPKFDAHRKDFQWKVEGRAGTITIKHVQTNRYLSNWGEKDETPFAPHYNCGPEFVYDTIQTVSKNWGSTALGEYGGFCKYDQGNLGFLYRSKTNINKYFKKDLERDFAHFIIELRKGPPTCEKGPNEKLWSVAKYFKERTNIKPIDPKYKLWKIQKV